MIGPAAGGLILYWSTPCAYIVDAVFLLLFAVFLTFLDLAPTPPKREPLSSDNVLAGIRFVIRNKIILATITLDLFAVLLGGATALLPAFAKDILVVGPGGFGLLRAAPAVGALMMALWMAHRPPMKRAGRNLVIAVSGFGLATIVFGLSRNYRAVICHVTADRHVR